MSLGHIAITPVFPLWLISILLSLALVSAIIQYWFIRRRLGRYRAISVSLLRLGSISLIISFALNPTLVVKKEHKLSPALAILVDTSQSMGLSGRLDKARALLLDGPRPLLRSLAERFEVRLYALGETLRAIEARELAGLKAVGEGGDLTDALDKLAGKNSLALLLSDGSLKWEGSNSAGLPLLVVPVGDPGGYKDILIKGVKAPTLAFRGREVTINVTIKGYGYKGLTLPVLLKDGGRLLTAKSLRINESPAEATLSLSFTPEEVGQHNLSISIPLQFGESLASNNTVNLPLKVVRDKIRILMVSGSPSMSYRFMRMAFKNDPSIDLLSFVILRTPSDIMNVPLQEQSLIPFPVETLFTKELGNFDLLIFDNFPFNPYLSASYLENVREFVKGGGGFAMIGGPNSFDEGGYAGTPTEELLPIRLTGRERYHRDSPWVSV